MNTVPGLVLFEDSNFTTIFELADPILKDKSISFLHFLVKFRTILFQINTNQQTATHKTWSFT